MMATGRDCKHWRLARSCELCEYEARIAELERDRLILAARLYAETDFAPETAEVMDRMRPLVEAEMNRAAQ